MPREPHTTTVIVPGLRGHVEDHWQTRLAAKLPNAVVVPSFTPRQARPGRPGRRPPPGHLGRQHPCHHRRPQRRCADHGALGPATRPAGPWRAARHTSRPRQTPRAAVPVTGRAARQRLAPHPLAPLRFPSIVAASTNDVLGDVERVRAMARAWGSHLIDIGPVGHLNPAAGYGEWLGAEALLGILNGSVPAHHHTGHVP